MPRRRCRAELADFSLTAYPDTNGRWRIAGAARIRAGAAGVAGAGYSSSPSQVRLRGSNGEILDLIFSSSANRVSGTTIDGFYESCTSVEPYHPGGPWHVDHFLLVDQAGHSTYLYPADL